MQRFFWRVLLPALLLSALALLTSSTVLQQPVALAYTSYPASPQLPYHAYVIGSDPVDGSTISNVPAVIRIFFNTNISPLSIAHVFNTQNGQFVAVQTPQSTVAAHNPRELDTQLLSPNTLSQGGYFVRWTAVADDDGHTTFGAIGFNVGYSSTGLSGTPTLGPSSSNALSEIQRFDFIAALGIAWQWLALLALLFWLGILLTERLILTRAERATSWLDGAQKQAAQVQFLCLSILLISELVTLLLRVLRLSETLTGGKIALSALWPLLIASNYGHLWLLRMLLIILALIFLRRSHNAPTKQHTAAFTNNTADIAPSSQHFTKESTVLTSIAPMLRTNVLWLFLAGIIVLTVALSNDAVQLAQAHASAILLTWLALVAQGIWFGGLTYLGYIFLPAVKEDANAEALTDFLKHFSPWLLAAIATFLISGLFFAESTVSTPGQLLSDAYGRTLLVTSILLLLNLLLSLYLLLVLRPSLARQAVFLAVVDADLPARRARRSALDQKEHALKQVLKGQTLLAATFLLGSVLLTFYAPPIVFPNVTYSNASSAANTTGITQSKSVNKLTITLEVLPGRVGYTNTVIIALNDANNKPVSDAKLQITTSMLTMDMGTSHITLNGGNSTYITSFNKNAAFSMVGAWQLKLTIQRPGQTDIQTSFVVTLEA